MNRKRSYFSTTALATAIMFVWLPLARVSATEPSFVTGTAAVKKYSESAKARDILADLQGMRRLMAGQRESIQDLLRQSRFKGAPGDKLRRHLVRLGRASLYLDIAASTGDRRRALIRQLPVTITTTRAVDGRVGSYREYAVNGTVRTSVFMPDAAPAAPSGSDRLSEQPDGSPGILVRPSADCNYEDEDGPFSGACVTQQEVDDALIVEADLLANEAQMEEDANSAQNDIDNWCQSNYPACQSDGPPDAQSVPTSGPFAGNSNDLADCPANQGPLECLAAGLEALTSAGYAVYSRVKLSQLVTSGSILTLPASALAWKVFLAVGSVAAAAIFIGAAFECYAELYYTEPKSSIRLESVDASKRVRRLGATLHFWEMECTLRPSALLVGASF